MRITTLHSMVRTVGPRIESSKTITTKSSWREVLTFIRAMCSCELAPLSKHKRVNTSMRDLRSGGPVRPARALDAHCTVKSSFPALVAAVATMRSSAAAPLIYFSWALSSKVHAISELVYVCAVCEGLGSAYTRSSIYEINTSTAAAAAAAGLCVHCRSCSAAEASLVLLLCSSFLHEFCCHCLDSNSTSYLDSYERVTFLGGDGDDKNNDNDDDDSSHPGSRNRKSVRALNLVPLTYNNSIHNVAESMRASSNLCTTLYKPSQYDRLFLSLTSPLPNEHDFSFNLCTLLSNEGKQVMRLALCPRLLEIMLGHVGVFRDLPSQKYFVSNIVEQKNKNLVQFWLDSVSDRRVLELLIPPRSRNSAIDHRNAHERMLGAEPGDSVGYSDGSCTKSDRIVEIFASSSKQNHVHTSDGSREQQLHGDDSHKNAPVNTSPSILVSSAEANSVSCGDSVTSSFREHSGNNNHNNNSNNNSIDSCEKSFGANLDVGQRRSTEYSLQDTFRRLTEELEMRGGLVMPEDVDLFHCGRDSGLQDSEGTRIAQLIHILRNLSFEEDNVATLAQSKTCLRFLVLCMCSRFGGLAIQALDTLGNIGSEVVLMDPRSDITSRLLLAHVSDGVFSEDRARVLRSLEVLNKLAVCDANEEVMGENIRQEVYDQICRYLTIHDIMLLIYTLESLYSLSSLGSASCNAIVRAQGSIHTLVALLTVEAQSYGPEACIGMKVVETVTGVVSDPEAAVANTAPPALPSSVTISTAPPPPPPPLQSTAATASPAPPAPPLLSSVVSTPTLAAANAAALQNSGGPNSGGVGNAIHKTPAKNVQDMKKSIMSSAIPSDVEEFVCDWIRRSYEAHPGTRLEQAVVFRHFSSAMHALGKKQGFNPVMLSSCFRKVYGFKVGPTRHNPKDASDKWYYHDLRRRDVPLPMRPADRLGKNKLFSSSVPISHSPILSRAESSSGSSILKAQLSAPLRPISPALPRPVQQQQTQQQALGASPGSSGSGAASPISSPPPPYSPNPRLSPRSTHSPSPYNTHPSPSATPPPPPPPMPRQENSALIKSLLAHKVTEQQPQGGLAGMLAAPLTTAPQSSLPTHSISLSYSPSQLPSTSYSSLQQQSTSSLPSGPQVSLHSSSVLQNSSFSSSHSSHSSQSSFSSSQCSSGVLPPPPPYPHNKNTNAPHQQRQTLPSMHVPSILKTSPPPIPSFLVASTATTSSSAATVNFVAPYSSTSGSVPEVILLICFSAPTLVLQFLRTNFGASVSPHQLWCFSFSAPTLVLQFLRSNLGSSVSPPQPWFFSSFAPISIPGASVSPHQLRCFCSSGLTLVLFQGL
ncbi:Armadillo-type fold [Trinorchestia longiramus]|nr:Armadillo-type fold [Trinorchestia longiramus]